jgi:hypothetical protein
LGVVDKGENSHDNGIHPEQKEAPVA